MIRSWLNVLLFLALLTTGALCWFITDRDVSRPNYDFLPEAQMAYSAAYDSFSPNPNFPDSLTLRSPPVGTIARGQKPLHYQPTPEDALRAGRELQNPFSEKDEARVERGSVVFNNFCQACHGPIGEGNGPATQHGLPVPASLLAERAVRMRDGQMFHVLTYGQGRMPALAAQLSREDRWSVILHVRMLQGPYGPSPATSRTQQVAKLFHENCAACHGDDGSGNQIRKVLPMIPDFTSMAWQMSQPELAIVNQIDYGSLPLMPAFRYKLRTEEILSLAVYVRSFAPHATGLPITAHLTAANIYGTYCFVCHDTTGRGNPQIRQVMEELPDFTSVAWQKTRKDADFTQSILLGKGKFMLPMSDKLGDVDVKQMVTLVRGFQGGKQIIPVEAPKPPGPPAPSVVAAPSANLPTPAPKSPSLVPPKVEQPLVALPGEMAARIRVGASIFRQYCIVCHGTDGKGTHMRPVLPPIPDFTNATWQGERNDAQLQVSILDGKGTMMPANRGRVTEEQVGDLVAFVRAFGPAKFLASQPQAGAQAGESDFEKSFRQLEEQWNQLEKELQKTRGQK
jgi:mono/diheme cytochrome c family protein